MLSMFAPRKELDTLIVITNDTDASMCLSQLTNYTYLCVICILILINKDILKLLTILFTNSFMVTKK